MKRLQKPFLLKIFYIIAIIVPFLMAVKVVMNGEIAFWYDPARDLLLALGNLEKPTFIGPTSGIPGLFYGPYWIWFLSGGLLISKDPRIVDFMVQTLPYFVIFPFILWKFSKVFGKSVVIILWLYFIFTFIQYATQMWNPYLAPLFSLILFYLLIFTDFEKNGKKKYIQLFLAGIFSGFIINFHISYGLGIFIGSFVFLFLYFIRILYVSKEKKNNLINFVFLIVFFGSGILVTFIPFLLFELRHGFQQIQVVIATISSPTAVVGLKGLSKNEIFMQFFSKPSQIFHISYLMGISIFFVSVFYIIYRIYKKEVILREKDKKFLLLCFSYIFSILGLYLMSKNPVWEYHFISIEILFLLLIGFVLSKSKLLEIIAFLWVIVAVVGVSILSFFSSLQNNPLSFPNLVTKEYTVNKIIKDSGGNDVGIAAYNAAIYTFDYDYLWRWKKNQNVLHSPSEITQKMNTIYLIVPKTDLEQEDTFMTYFTPINNFRTGKRWQMPDGTIIVKRQRVTVQKP